MNIFDHIRENGDDDMPEPEAAEPTDIRPGTKERIEIYRRRLETGVSLFSDEDPKNYADGSRGEMPVNKSRPATTPAMRDDPVRSDTQHHNGRAFV